MAMSTRANAKAAIVVGGRYELVRQLGQGGMGAVYEAVHLGTGRHVALKVMVGHARAHDPEFVARFQREARVASAVESRHIVQVLDAGVEEVGGHPYMVLELLSGMDVLALVHRRGPLPVDVALRIAAQACSGLQRAHEAGVTHRDIKSANLFLARGEPGEVLVKVLDFGIAKLRPVPGAERDAGLSLTHTGAVMGSPMYMSPEQATGAKQADARSDIWSLGAVLYEVLCGRPPHFDCETLNSLIVAICTRPPRPLPELAPWVPPTIDAIVRKALSIDSNLRFQTAGELRAAIDRFLPQGSALDESVFGAEAATVAATSSPATLDAERARAAHAASVATTSSPATLDAGHARAAHSEPFRRRGVPIALLGTAATVFVALGAGAFVLHRHGFRSTPPAISAASLRSAAAPASEAATAAAPAGSDVATIPLRPRDDIDKPAHLPAPIGAPKGSPSATGTKAYREPAESPTDPSTPEWARCPHNIAVCMSECNNGKAASCYALAAVKEGGADRTPPDYQQALRYYKQACAGGDARGCAAAARIDAAKPSNAAHEHYELEQIESECEGARISMCVMLGNVYENGSYGVAKSPSLALAAYKHGCDAGDSGSCLRLKFLQQRMPATP
jgi:eukaryotic-like serine/threonine-protein kinase